MKKLMLFGFLLVLTSLMVFATAPTIPSTISPDNNSVWFNDPTLTCSGSTDPDGDNINYSFYVDGNLAQNSESTTYVYTSSLAISWWNNTATCQGGAGNCDYYIGSGVSDPNWALGRNDAGASLVAYDQIVFNNPELIVNLQVDVSGSIYVTRMTIDGVVVWSKTSAFSKQNVSIDVSSYMDGLPHDVGFNVDSNSGSTGTIRFWADFETVTSQSGWYCQACDNTSACSDFTETRALRMVSFLDCSSGDMALNFTVKDEETDDLLQDVTFDAAWTLESAWDSLLYNFGLSGENEYQFCLIPEGVDVNITGFVEYDSTNSSYSFPRQYYFQDATINGEAFLDISLFQLSDTFATPVTFTAISGATTVEDVLIHLQRYDPGTGTYTLVAMGKTGASGQDIIYLRLTDAWYRVLAYDGGELAYTGDPEHILDSTYTISLSGGEGGMSDYWDNWNALDTINYNLAFNESGTNHFTLTADDGSGASTSMCLKVEKWSMLDGMQEVYYECESSASITMSYEVTDLDATYIAEFIAFFDGGWRLIDSEEVSLSQNLSDMIGMDGIIYAILFIGIIAFIGLWNPIAAVSLTMFGLIISFMIGLVNVTWAALIGILIAGGIILFKIRE